MTSLNELTALHFHEIAPQYQANLTGVIDSGAAVAMRVTRVFPAPFTGSTVVVGDLPKVSHQVVLKIAPNAKSIRREWEGLLHVTGLDGKCQQPVALVQTAQGQLGLLSEYIEGEVLKNSSEVARRAQVGERMRELHERVPVHGEEWRKSPMREFHAFLEAIERWQHDSDFLQHIRHTLALPILERLARELTTHKRIESPAFIHTDIHDEQVLISQEGVAILLDFEQWQEGDPVDDLAIYLFHILRNGAPLEYFQAALAGYGSLDFLVHVVQLRTVLAFHTLFFATRAVRMFARYRPEYLPLSVHTLEEVCRFLATDALWAL